MSACLFIIRIRLEIERIDEAALGCAGVRFDRMPNLIWKRTNMPRFNKIRNAELAKSNEADSANIGCNPFEFKYIFLKIVGLV